MPRSLPSVSLYIRIKDAKGRRYERVNRRNPQLQGGVYCLHFYENGRRKWATVGTDINEAVKARMQKECELLGETHQSKGASASQGVSVLADAIQKYQVNVAALKSLATAHGYGYALRQFQLSCSKLRLRDVNVQDLRNYIVFMKKQDLSDRTISNRVADVVTFLRHYGIKDVTIRHKYTEKIVKAYHPDDLKLLFCAASPEEWITFQFFLCTGGREQEVMHACWSDIDFADSVFTIRDHPERGFTTKDHEEREIPLPGYLIAKLKERVRTSDLIFPTREGKPNGHFLRVLKAVAKRAGMDPDECGLHKFRKSYATLQHENGVSARTMQKRLGHSSLETTLAYLEAAEVRSAESRKAVDDTFAVFA